MYRKHLLLKHIRIFIKRTLGRKWVSNRLILAKALLYRCFSVLATFFISFMITGNLDFSLGISAVDLVGKTMLYFFFEKGWNDIQRGSRL